MAVSEPPRTTQMKTVSFNTAQGAGTYDLLTASGDVWVEIVGAYVKSAGGGFTTVAITSNHTTPKTVVTAIAAAAVTLDLGMTIVTSSFLLPSGKKIQGVIVGTGNAGEIILVVRWASISGSTLV